jgi:hypothetical protein
MTGAAQYFTVECRCRNLITPPPHFFAIDLHVIAI